MAIKPHDWSEPLLRISKLQREVEQALLARHYTEASEVVNEIMTETGRLMIWLGSKKDGDF